MRLFTTFLFVFSLIAGQSFAAPIKKPEHHNIFNAETFGCFKGKGSAFGKIFSCSPKFFPPVI